MSPAQRFVRWVQEGGAVSERTACDAGGFARASVRYPLSVHLKFGAVLGVHRGLPLLEHDFRLGDRSEPTSRETLSPDAAVERFAYAVVNGLSGSTKV